MKTPREPGQDGGPRAPAGPHRGRTPVRRLHQHARDHRLRLRLRRPSRPGLSRGPARASVDPRAVPGRGGRGSICESRQAASQLTGDRPVRAPGATSTAADLPLPPGQPATAGTCAGAARGQLVRDLSQPFPRPVQQHRTTASGSSSSRCSSSRWTSSTACPARPSSTSASSRGRSYPPGAVLLLWEPGKLAARRRMPATAVPAQGRP